MSNSKVSVLVQKVTNPKNEYEDWDAILQICDLMAQKPDETCAAVVHQIFSTISHPHPKTRYFSVALLDACVKNSNQFFQNALIRQPTMNQLDSMLKNDSDSSVVEKWEEMSEAWKREYPSLYRAATTGTSNQLYSTSPSSPPSQQQKSPSPPAASSLTFHHFDDKQQSQASTRPSSKQKSQVSSKQSKTDRIQNDLTVVLDNCTLMIQFIQNAVSVQSLRKDDAAQQIHVNMQEMNRRLVALIDQIPDESLLMRTLEVHEHLFAVLDCYEHYLKTGEKNMPSDTMSTSSPLGHPAATTTTQSSTNLIDDMDLFFDTPVAAPASTTRFKGKGHVNSPIVETSRQGAETMSLDDFLSAPPQSQQQSSNYDDPFGMDMMQQEIHNAQQGSSSDRSSGGGFAALARRKNPQQNASFASSPNPFSPVSDSTQAEPNPFDIAPQTQQQPSRLFTPRSETMQESPQSLYPSSNNNLNNEGAGFAAVARRRKVTPDADSTQQSKSSADDINSFFE